jgi:hypothetical protein
VAAISLAAVFSFSSIVLGNRVFFDGILRSNVQTALLNQGTERTFTAIESAAKKLYSDPEYAVQALSPLAAIGDGVKLETVSKATFDYYPNSIQATLIRADVLRALNRNLESCPLRDSLIVNTPWQGDLVNKYIECHMGGIVFPDLQKNLRISSQYFLEIDRTKIPENGNELNNLVDRLVAVSNRARVLYILGQIEPARELQAYGNSILPRLLVLRETNPTLISEVQIRYLTKLLDFN